MALALTALAGCAKPTAFQPAQNGFDGYTVTEVETGRFRLSFNGNAVTPRPDVDNALLYLAARVTLTQGGSWFELQRDTSDKSTSYPTFLGSGTYIGGGRLSPPLYVPGNVQTDFSNPQDSWTDTATILVRQGQKPAGDNNAYDARDVEAHLHALIRRDGVAGPY